VCWRISYNGRAMAIRSEAVLCVAASLAEYADALGMVWLAEVEERWSKDVVPAFRVAVGW